MLRTSTPELTILVRGMSSQPYGLLHTPSITVSTAKALQKEIWKSK